MAKGLLKNYTFNVAAKTITLTDVTTVRLDKLALITDVTTNKILYNFADLSVATATVATNVITLSALQGGEANGDKLRIDYDVESTDTNAFTDTTQPVSMSTIPVGASTSALQTTGNTSLSSIDTKTPALGQALAAASSPVVLPASQITTLTPPAAITGYALEAGHLATIDTSTAKIPAQGQALAAASMPVVLPAAQITTLTPPAAITGFALDSTVAKDATLTNRTQKTQLTDGTRDGTVKAASTLPALTDTAVVTTQRDPLPAGTNVIGHIIADTGSTTAVTGNVTIVQPTGTNLHTVTDSGSVTAATLSAETTKVIGVVRTADGSGNLLTSTTNALDVNLKTSSITLPVSGTVTTTPPSNASTNIAQVNGITALTGTGATGTGSQRVTVAVDSATVAGSASLPTGSNIIGALTANQSVNNTQVNGVTTQTGVGASGTGTQRVVTATDSTIGTVTALTAITNALPAGTNLMGKVGIDQTTPGTTNRVDIGTVNGQAPAFNTGVRGATVQRVTVATDDLVPISAASLPLPALAATSTKQSDGSQKTQLVDGSGTVIGPAIVSSGNNLPTAIGATNYVASTVNSTSAQLAANATFTGTIETTFNQQSYSLLLVTDQNGTLTLNQYTDAGGTQLNSSIVIPVTANVPLAQSNVVNGNFFNIVYKNLGPKTTTTLKIDIAYGTIPATTQLNNTPVSLNEIGGTALTAGQKTGALSVPVVLSSDTAGPITNPEERNLLEQLVALISAQNDSLGIAGAVSNPNLRRALDNNGQEVVTLIADRSKTGKASVTLTASTTETTLINGDPQNYLDIIMVAVTNTSASTVCRVDLRDTTGGTVVKSWNTVGGTSDQGFSLVGVAVPQTTKGNNWTVQCSVSTTDVRVFALYALRPN